MRITKENITKYLDKDGNLILRHNKEITHIDFIPNYILCINIAHSNVEEITCELPDGLEEFYCHNSKLIKLPLLPKSLVHIISVRSNLPNEFKVNITDNNQCNKLRNLQLLELI